MTDLSIVVCTRDRAPQLQEFLNRLPQGELRAAKAELVLVDNASRDATPDVIARYAAGAEFPVRSVAEPTPGLSRARNAGLAAAQAPLVAFTDDDCYLTPEFPARVKSAFADASIGYLGGRVQRFDPSDAMVACLHRDTPLELAPYRFLPAGILIGANMAFRRTVIDAVGPFDEEFGAGTPFRCEDIDYLARCSLAGFRGRYLPDLVVLHHHGRKSVDAAKLRAANDVARGAYYAKFILKGNARFAAAWALRAGKVWQAGRILRELKGAAMYARRAA